MYTLRLYKTVGIHTNTKLPTFRLQSFRLMDSATLKHRKGFSTTAIRKVHQSGKIMSKGLPNNSSGNEDKRANTTSGSSGSSAQPTGNKRSLSFAIGGVLTLLGVATYTFFLRQPSDIPKVVEIPEPPSATTTMQSIARKYDDARTRLDGLSRKERRSEAKRLEPLTDEEVNAILHAKENSWCLGSASSIKLRVDANQVSSNDPIEDYLAWDELKPGNGTDQSRYIFGVFDGHAGYMCAQQIAERIGPMMNASLEAVSKSENFDINDSNLQLAKTVKQLRREAGLNWDHASLALTATFINMDHELVYGALEEFRKAKDFSRIDSLLGPAVSGSCGLVAVVDTDSKEIVVGNTGDSRALLGVRLPDGRWKAVRLSEDQTAKNKKEFARMTREHPGEDAVINKGRVLGGLMPTRAFGDCRYKWPIEIQQDLFPILYSRGHRYATTPQYYYTPPYVTARPVIVRHKLSDNDKFIVIASDGLYDQLSDAEVIDAVSQWYDANLDKKSTMGNAGLKRTTEDNNAATHLIRAALSTDRLGRRGDEIIRRLLAIPPPLSRRFRDDISVTIISLDRD